MFYRYKNNNYFLKFRVPISYFLASDIFYMVFVFFFQFEARKIVMYLCQELSGVYLKGIQEYFNLSHIGSVSFNTSTIRKKRKADKRFGKKIDKVVGLIAKQASCPLILDP